MDVRGLAARLEGTSLGSRLRLGVPMAGLVSFRTGGPADAVVEVSDPAEIASLVWAAAAAGVPYLLLGLGTNVLVQDGGIRGLVIRLVPPPGDGPSWESDPPAVVAASGVPLAWLSRAAAGQGLSGLEFAEGIPGTLGGAVVMNAGAYGGDIASVVEWAEVLDLDAITRSAQDAGCAQGPPVPLGRAAPPLPGPVRRQRHDLGFGYRKSALQAPGRYAVTRVKISLVPGDLHEIKARMDELAERRRSRQPLEHPSAGSFFMRPGGCYAGPMIEACGLKGYRTGGAMVSPQHANFIVNLGNATSADVLAVARHVQETVHRRYGVWLEPEVRIVGEPAGRET